ncbi:MAG: protein adenylyltransferase SelO family protein [Pseudomonadota bacterium]
MNIIVKNIKQESISSLYELSTLADYSLLDTLVCDPGASATGEDYQPRQVFSGHYVPVLPTPIEHPEYVAHSPTLFDELGFDASLAQTTDFIRLFSGDVSHLPAPMLKTGWATGYALSIYGTEYIQQCPFQTGNGYGDGRAISVLEVAIGDKRWEMQLKGAGRTPYCRGADGRAVLRSSVREFLAQEHMHALDIPTSRSLSLFASKTERVNRPWYFEGSTSQDPEVMVSNPVAISTRVASSFLRVGQIELFARRARNNAHPNAMKELEMIVSHLIDREYKDELDDSNIAADSLLSLAIAFRGRLTSLVTDWLRVGYCQGNFNSDNCAAGGYTLDYGPFGFCERFDPVFQPWTGGGRHFSFFNQPVAAEKNFDMFCKSLAPLLSSQPQALDKLESIRLGFADEVEHKMHCMWASKLGIHAYSSGLFVELMELMIQTSVDYTIFFRELSSLPSDVSALHKSFYKSPSDELLQQWQSWFQQWHERIEEHCEKASLSKDTLSERMKRVNPKYTWREWLVAPAYQQAEQGDYALIKELQQVLTRPYDEQSKEIEDKFYQLRPEAFSFVGGITHYSCSS